MKVNDISPKPKRSDPVLEAAKAAALDCVRKWSKDVGITEPSAVTVEVKWESFALSDWVAVKIAWTHEGHDFLAYGHDQNFFIMLASEEFRGGHSHYITNPDQLARAIARTQRS